MRTINENEGELTGDYAIVAEEIHVNEERLAKSSLHLKKVIQEIDELLANRLLLIYVFENSSNLIKMRIRFLGAIREHPGGFLIQFTTPDNRKMMVDDWIKGKGDESIRSQFNYAFTCDDFRKFTKGFFALLIRLVEKDLRSVVEGTGFIETPFAWDDYK